MNQLQSHVVQKEDLKPYFTLGVSLMQLLFGVIGLALLSTIIWEFIL